MYSDALNSFTKLPLLKWERLFFLHFIFRFEARDSYPLHGTSPTSESIPLRTIEGTTLSTCEDQCSSIPNCAYIFFDGSICEMFNVDTSFICGSGGQQEDCRDWGLYSKHDNGCDAFSFGWSQDVNNDCSSCDQIERDYNSCDLDECKALCKDLYGGNHGNIEQCQDGCDQMEEIFSQSLNDTSIGVFKRIKSNHSKG